MKRILVASDLSKRSRRALRRAVALARQFGCELFALHVADDDRREELIAAECRSAEAEVREHLAEAAAEGLAPEAVIVTRAGDPFKVIADEADGIEADLIVMGAHRKRLLGDVFTGTTIERVIRLGSRPVLMVNRDGDRPYRQVLAALDLSQASAHALRVARDIGVLDPARAAAVHGFLPIGEGMMQYANVDQERVDEHVAISASEARTALADFLRNNGFGDMADVLLIEKGSPYEAIETGVQKFKPDLLVIGTRGHSGVKRVLLGSIADQVLRQIDVDILAVPPERTSPSG
jgi:nucleotide-binding universal stress UspA family protein